MHLKLTVAYDGTAFRGWARQPGQRTVEGALLGALDRVYDAADRLTVAGRTDTGVHALANIVSVDVTGGPPVSRAVEALNTALPEVVAVVRADGLNTTSTRAVRRARALSIPHLAAAGPLPFEVTGRSGIEPLDLQRLRAPRR